MMNPSEARRLINNELQTRAFNMQAKKVLKAHTPAEERADLHIDFHCECSDEDCTERIALTLAEYEKLHQEGSQFVVAKGHQTPAVEKVEQHNQDLMVVKKYAL